MSVHRDQCLTPPPGEVHLIAGKRLVDVARVGPVETDILVHLAQEIGRLLELRVGHLGPVLQADDQARQRVGIVDIVADGDAALEFRIGQNPQRLRLLGRHIVGAVEQCRVAPVERHEPRLAIFGGGEVLHRHDAGIEVLPAGDPGGVERLQQARVAPFRHALRTGVRDVGLEARPHLLKSLVLVAEEGEGRLGAVLGGVGGMQQRILVTGPVEHHEIAAAFRPGIDRTSADHAGGGKRQAA